MLCFRDAVAIVGLAVTLVSCDQGSSNPLSRGDDAGARIEEQAIAKGILPDPDNLVFGGRFETRSELGTDKFCAVGNGTNRYNIGVLAVFGPESKCEARGTATITQEKVRIALQGEGACEFDAEFDGNELRFPGKIPGTCADYCSDRASLSGTRYFMVEQGDNNARRTLGRDIEKLCS